MPRKKIEFHFRLYVDLDGERLFGPGRAELLQLIEETGSISKAAKAMGMSYKKAWGMVDEMNEKGRNPLVVAQKGGTQGGGTALTPEGKKIVKSYDQILQRINSMIDKEKSFLDLF